MFKPLVGAIFGGTALILGMASDEARAAEKECFAIATLKISFQVVFPNARQVTIEGDAAKAYLTESNSFGRPTTFAGETLFMNILPNGTAMLIPLKDGLGCHRMIVGPRLHKVIMAKVSLGAV